MSEIFGLMWVERFGSKPTESWREELRTWSIPLASAVLVHYRRAGFKFPPTLSQVGKLARELKPSLEITPALQREYRPTEVMQAFRRQEEKVELNIENYRKRNRGASKREACLAFLSERGLVKFLPESIIAEERSREAEQLRRDTTAAMV